MQAGEYRIYIDEKVESPAVSVKEVEGVHYFDVNPNPSSGQLRVQFELETSQSYELGLYDISGKKIKTIHQGNGHQINYESDIDLKIPAGVYFVKLQTDKGILAVRKWVVL